MIGFGAKKLNCTPKDRCFHCDSSPPSANTRHADNAGDIITVIWYGQQLKDLDKEVIRDVIDRRHDVAPVVNRRVNRPEFAFVRQERRESMAKTR